MATKTKTRTKTTTKAKGKVAPAAKAKAKAEAPVSKRAAQADNDADLLKRAKAFREDGLTLSQIADKLKVTTNKVGFLFLVDSVRPADRIKGTDKEIAAAIVRGRDNDLLSWPTLMARTGFTQQRVKAIYEKATGQSANQGYAVVQARNPKPASKPKTTKTTKASTKAKTRVPAKGRKAGKKAANPS